VCLGIGPTSRLSPVNLTLREPAHLPISRAADRRGDRGLPSVPREGSGAADQPHPSKVDLSTSVRQDAGQRFTNPIMMKNDVVIQTSEQAAEPMLCSACEQHIGRDESYVADLAYRDGALGLLGLVPSLSIFRIGNDDGGVFGLGASIAALNCQSIARFAASVFWRAHVAMRPKVQALRLWNPQAKSLRLFIRGEAPLPPRMCINMIAIVDGETMTRRPLHASSSPGSSGPRDDGVDGPSSRG
jgi:hypothetical protein